MPSVTGRSGGRVGSVLASRLASFIRRRSAFCALCSGNRQLAEINHIAATRSRRSTLGPWTASACRRRGALRSAIFRLVVPEVDGLAELERFVCGPLDVGGHDALPTDTLATTKSPIPQIANPDGSVVHNEEQAQPVPAGGRPRKQRGQAQGEPSASAAGTCGILCRPEPASTLLRLPPARIDPEIPR